MLYERIKKEIEEFEHEVKSQGIDYVYNQAYYIAFITELEFIFTELLEPEEVENEYAILNKVEGNICESIMDYFINFRHPENYNPFLTETMLEIIGIYIKENLEENNNG